ncbi:hypothetical protein DNTS_030374, partial [Danionella cerebrum]
NPEQEVYPEQDATKSKHVTGWRRRLTLLQLGSQETNGASHHYTLGHPLLLLLMRFFTANSSSALGGSLRHCSTSCFNCGGEAEAVGTKPLKRMKSCTHGGATQAQTISELWNRERYAPEKVKKVMGSLSTSCRKSSRAAEKDILQSIIVSFPRHLQPLQAQGRRNPVVPDDGDGLQQAPGAPASPPLAADPGAMPGPAWLWHPPSTAQFPGPSRSQSGHGCYGGSECIQISWGVPASPESSVLLKLLSDVQTPLESIYKDCSIKADRPFIDAQLLSMSHVVKERLPLVTLENKVGYQIVVPPGKVNSGADSSAACNDTERRSKLEQPLQQKQYEPPAGPGKSSQPEIIMRPSSILTFEPGLEPGGPWGRDLFTFVTSAAGHMMRTLQKPRKNKPSKRQVNHRRFLHNMIQRKFADIEAGNNSLVSALVPVDQPPNHLEARLSPIESEVRDSSPKSQRNGCMVVGGPWHSLTESESLADRWMELEKHLGLLSQSSPEKDHPPGLCGLPAWREAVELA